MNDSCLPDVTGFGIYVCVREAHLPINAVYLSFSHFEMGRFSVYLEIHCSDCEARVRTSFDSGDSQAKRILNIVISRRMANNR